MSCSTNKTVYSRVQQFKERLLLTWINRDFSNSAALCFMETWLNGTIPDSALYLLGFQLFRAYCTTEATGKTRGSGLCFYMNEGWYRVVTTLKMLCCSNLEGLLTNWKPFYSPREFSSFILVSVYIPPDACVSYMLQLLAEQVTDTEQQHPDSLIIRF